MASRPSLVGPSGDVKAPPTEAGMLPAERRAHRKSPCAECGMIESISASRTPPGSGGREITVRLENGSMRVIVDANPATWRPGERVVVIDGLVGPGA
jgi:hypothetical protein